MLLRLVVSSILTLSLCIPFAAQAANGKFTVDGVTYYYSANDRIYAKEIDGKIYYRSSPEFLQVRHPTCHNCHKVCNYNGCFPKEAYYTRYVDEQLDPYHWSYVHRVNKDLERALVNTNP